MIVALSVENFAIIERVELELGAGFTAMTGETGAGKSLLVDAIELALGERADTELVRSGSDRASVRVGFDLSSRPDLMAACEERGFPTEDGQLHIHREVLVEGRSICRIGGRLAPVATLRELGRLLVDLHGQHDHQSLFHPESHVGLLDAWIGDEASGRLARIATLASDAARAKAQLESLRKGLRDREHRLDLLRFQTKEIREASPRPGELAELEAKLQRLQHAEKLRDAAAATQAALIADDRTLDHLAEAQSAINPGARIDPELESVAQILESALMQLREAASGLDRYLDSLEADPGALEDTATRLDALKRLFRKYGDDEQAVLEFLVESEAELARLEDAEASEEELLGRYEGARNALHSESKLLSELRKSAAATFDRQVADQLGELAMERAQFSTVFREREPDAQGLDDVEFYFSANAGEPARPLAKIASGGEVSRLMLAIKGVLAGVAGVPTLIFDEVDAGLGGTAAATVARKLAELAKHRQVVVITHLPSIAARAATQLRIEKEESEGRTSTHLRLLAPFEREDEVARMIGGEPVTDAAREAARILLDLRGAALF